MPGVAVVSVKKSPSLNQDSNAILVDENDRRLEIAAVVFPNASGESGIPASGISIEAGSVSPVTALEDGAKVVQPGTNGKAKVLALMSMDASGNLIPFVAPSAASALEADHATSADSATSAGSADEAAKVTGKFVSAELTGTGASQDIAHGLGVVPGAVLVSITDDNSGAGFSIVEGVHDDTNVKVTVTLDAKFKVLALA